MQDLVHTAKPNNLLRDNFVNAMSLQNEMTMWL